MSEQFPRIDGPFVQTSDASWTNRQEVVADDDAVYRFDTARGGNPFVQIDHAASARNNWRAAKAKLQSGDRSGAARDAMDVVRHRFMALFG